MAKGPTFRQANAQRHMTRVATPLWYEECAAVDIRVLRLQMALEEPGKLTYQARILLKEMRSEVSKVKEHRARGIERRWKRVSSEANC